LDRKDRKPRAFMSYAHTDDDDGRLSEFRNKLSAQTQKLIGERFPIFQDHEDIKWGQEWESRIEESLAEVTFFIPIITPSFFRSQHCRDELARFLEREKRLGLKLILPVYYIETALIEDKSKRTSDELAQKIASRQYADCRDILIEDMDSQKIRRLIYNLAAQIRDIRDHLPTKATNSAVKVPPKPKDAQHLENLTIPPHRDIVVDQMYHSDYATISEAIKAANPGDRILVRPGLYQEGMIIEKPLEIVGEGERDEIVVQALGQSALLFKTTSGRVANLTLRQIGGEGNWFGVDIAQGRLTVEDCDISCQSHACVAIHGGADPRLRRNKIHDGEKSGVFVLDNGQGIIEENDIFGNTLSGVEIKEGSNPTLRRNKVHNGKQIGVFVYENGQGILVENDIFGNAWAGVVIAKAGNPTLRHNNIHDGKQGGVFVLDNGQGIFVENDIFGNTLSGVEIKEGSNPTLRRNKVHDGKQIGVFVLDNGQGILVENDIFGNAWAGVVIAKAGNPTLRHNNIHDGKQGGVFVLDNGQGIIEENDIFENAITGVEIKTGGNPTLRHNKINRNKSSAIYIHDNGGGVIEDNDLRDNKKGAWKISRDSKSKVKRSGNLE